MHLLRALPGTKVTADKDTELTKMSVLALGFLWCQADSYNRAELFFECLNPPEMNQNSEYIAWTDKEFPVVFDTIVKIAIITIP